MSGYKDRKSIWVIRICTFMIICLIALGAELFCNRHALGNSAGMTDLSGSIETRVKEKNGEVTFTLEYEFEEPVYAEELILRGSFPEQLRYQGKIFRVNGFGAAEETEFSDYVNAWFNEFYTPVAGKIRGLEVYVPAGEGGILTNVLIKNSFHWNFYRMIFVVILLMLVYLVLFEEFFSERMENLFAVYAILFGILLILAEKPAHTTWDEMAHFANSYRLSQMPEVSWTEAAECIRDGKMVLCNTEEEYAFYNEYLNQADKEAGTEEILPFSLHLLSFAGYVPQALFLKLGRKLGMTFSKLYAFGKAGNLVLYIICMYIAIRFARCRKLFIVFLAMMPTMLFQACSYSYDTLVNSFLILGCVIWANMMFAPEQQQHGFLKICLFTALTVAGCASKAVYIPLILLFILLPQVREIDSKIKWIATAVVICVTAVGILSFAGPVIRSALTGTMIEGDLRGGNTSITLQLISLLKHPAESVRMLFGNIFSFDNFRNRGGETDRYFFGNLMLLNHAVLGVLSDKWSAVITAVYTFLFLYQENSEERSPSRRERAGILVIILAVIVLIWTAMYLAFTPVGASVVEGVQARYYLPLLYPLFLGISFPKLTFSGDRMKVRKGILLTAIVLEAACMYSFVIAARLL